MEAKSLDMVLSIDQGVLVTLGPEKNGENFSSAIRGWKTNEYILLDRPPTTAVQAGRDCVIRILRDGYAYGFGAKVLDGGLTRPPQFRIAWPNNLRSVGLRKYDRLTLKRPCSVKLPCGDILEGELHDISEGGCGVYVDEDIPKGIEVGLNIRLTATLEFEEIRATARSSMPRNSQYFIGFAFHELGEEARCAIDNLIATTLLAQRAISMNGIHVLIFNGDPELTQTLCEVVKSTPDLDVQGVSNAVDAFHGLRSLLPDIMVLPLVYGDFSAVDFCKMIFSTPGLESLPVVVYGNPESSTVPELLEAGVRDIIGDSDALRELLVDRLATPTKPVLATE